MNPTDSEGCFTREDGECVSPGPCMHTAPGDEVTKLRAELAEVKADRDAARERLGPVSPGGDDRVDELESAMGFLRHEKESAAAERDDARAKLAIAEKERDAARREDRPLCDPTHETPDDCPTWYDHCHCTVEALEFNLKGHVEFENKYKIEKLRTARAEQDVKHLHGVLDRIVNIVNPMGKPCGFCKDDSCSDCRIQILVSTTRRAIVPKEAAPIPMVLLCPMCHHQHVDEPNPKIGWTNPPHRSHLCGTCGTVWRPADVPTVGVIALMTHGSKDTWPRDRRG